MSRWSRAGSQLGHDSPGAPVGSASIHHHSQSVGEARKQMRPSWQACVRAFGEGSLLSLGGAETCHRNWLLSCANVCFLPKADIGELREQGTYGWTGLSRCPCLLQVLLELQDPSAQGRECGMPSMRRTDSHHGSIISRSEATQQRAVGKSAAPPSGRLPVFQLPRYIRPCIAIQTRRG
jgi:hypothetical protein